MYLSVAGVKSHSYWSRSQMGLWIMVMSLERKGTIIYTRAMLRISYIQNALW
jgi:hypothetical protein